MTNASSLPHDVIKPYVTGATLSLSYTHGYHEQVDNAIAGFLQGTGIIKAPTLYINLSRATLIEHAISNQEGTLSKDGAFVVKTGQFTGRAAGDKFVVDEDEVRDQIQWGDINHKLSPAHFTQLLSEVGGYLQGQPLYIQDLYAGRDMNCCTPIRLITTSAWHALFAKNMFVRPEDLSEEEKESVKQNNRQPYTILHAPHLFLNADRCGTHGSTAVTTSFKEKLIVICGTQYAGEIKKSIFSAMNWQLPAENILPMHCSANIGQDGDVAIFFGLSGTGKTTLSSDPERILIGDDEHGWSKTGIFNIEGGCYAKVINLNKKTEPEIWSASLRFGSVLENVILNTDASPDFDNNSLTENTRSCYPVDFIPNASTSGKGGLPLNIVMLTADAFGVLPPISKLTNAQAIFHFLMGYTARIAGTESGLGKEPKATFSPCFGAPFLPRPADVYGALLMKRLEENPDIQCWLINTGWSGGPYGIGKRFSLPHTRQLLHMALNHSLKDVPFETEKHFGLQIPTKVNGIPSELLNPALCWADPQAYHRQAEELAKMFQKHFETLSQNLQGAIRFDGDIFSSNLTVKRL
ncbi:phosphoenolpyruvate carboxykinase (ATP) [Commensalibacter nepenthis]|uniref:Phosphoenolpyruvate carboxykinase (ATP) n=1 Tax=Commensalibacter nepenthis TaxID=3043872 RepID=A0ABT6Q8W1_9PROT|nr:phosphoenolpyruvate carboxykinase (ATP) [Commensalibacter sp. TBRC 10068]MDI2113329.1 phosphoenolpyruvate carboxykinase (ATP) [Commensalibacter sp. TBRC 10068]